MKNITFFSPKGLIFITAGKRSAACGKQAACKPLPERQDFCALSFLSGKARRRFEYLRDKTHNARPHFDITKKTDNL